MRRPFTIDDIKKSKVAALNLHITCAPKKKKETVNKAKTYIAFRLAEFCKENNYTLTAEYKFDPVRRWRFDHCIPEIMCAFEYNGVFSAKSRHTTVTGYTGDMEKINKAQSLGWKVYQYTALNYMDLMIDLINLKNSL